MSADRNPPPPAPARPGGFGEGREPPQGGGEAAAPCDLGRLRQKTLGDPAFLAELLDIFREDLPGHLEALRGALWRREAEELSRAAHAFLGSLRLLEAAEATGLASRLRKRAQAGDFAGAALTLTALEAEVERLAAFLAAVYPR
ncbi:MAG: Hpt domain-containing protein [Thermodesulfobacteriota bacterium]